MLKGRTGVYSTSQVVHVGGNSNNGSNARVFTLKANSTTSYGKMGFSSDRRTNMAGRKPTHGMSGTRPYGIWRGMKLRCDAPDARLERWYGDIGYDPKWSTFAGFWDDMKAGYADDLTLDRIDPSKGYSKENCRWATMHQQSRNRRDNVWIPYNGEMLCVSDYATKVGLPRALIYQRVKRGVPFSKLDAPSRKKAKPTH